MPDNEYPAVTLALLRQWWADHPQERAEQCIPFKCIVAKPLRDITGENICFVPANRFLSVWDDGGNVVVAFIPVGPEIQQLGVEFDCGYAINIVNGTVGFNAEKCVALIDRVASENAGQ